jgi:hypothetical protein
LRDLGLAELDGGPRGHRIKVFVDRRHDKKVLAQMMKTTFCKYLFLTVKYFQNAAKYRLLKGTHARDFMVRFSQFFGIIQ